jgi:hypothetical protein
MALKIVFVVIPDWLIQMSVNGNFSVVVGVSLQIEFYTISLCDN